MNLRGRSQRTKTFRGIVGEPGLDGRSPQEREAIVKADQLTRHIMEQIEKRQYLNAVWASIELTQELLRAFSAVLKGP